MPNGLGGEPGSQMSTGTVVATPPVTASLSLSSPPLTASVPDRDDDLRVGHPVVGRAQRAGHAARAGPGDQQHVGVPRAGGEEHAEPVQVVDRAEQRLDLPLLAAVGPGVHVPDVHAAAQRRGPFAQPGTGRLDGRVGLREFGDDQLLPGQRGRAGSARDQPNTSGRSATQRPHRMHLPWSTRTVPPVTVMAPVGHRPEVGGVRRGRGDARGLASRRRRSRAWRASGW